MKRTILSVIFAMGALVFFLVSTGYGQTGSIEGTIFNDVNSSGYVETGEPGLIGWMVQCINEDTSVIRTVHSGPDGLYLVSNLPAGTYRVVTFSQPCWRSNTPYLLTVPLADGAHTTGIDFGFVSLAPGFGSLRGEVFWDLNGNGMLDTIMIPGVGLQIEPPVPGWGVHLGALSATTVFDGTYSFGSLTYGTYTPTYDTRSCVTQTPPPGGYSVTINGCWYPNGVRNLGLTPQSIISGRKYCDVNANNHYDAGTDFPLPNQIVTLGTTFSVVTDADGKFKIYAPAGVYALTTPGLGPHYSLSIPGGTGSYPIAVSDACESYADRDFAFRVVDPITSLAADAVMYGALCCAHPITFLIHYTNTGTLAITTGEIKLQISPHLQYLDYVSSPMLSTPSISSGGNQIVWSLPNPLLPGASGTLSADILILCGSSDPLEANRWAHVTVSSSHGHPVHDMFQSIALESPCSHDPNDKSVTPKGCGIEGYIAPTDSLEYLIRFQNTGAYAAYRVIVKDTLDADLDMATVNNLGSSHPGTFSVDGRVLTWSFLDIILPDSASNEPGSNGYVKFLVKPGPGAGNGTVITNRAGVYFDMNEVVMTPTVTNTITTDPLPAASFSVNPHYSGGISSYDFAYTGGTPGLTAYYWDFGPGASPETSMSSHPVGILFPAGGIQVAVLRVGIGTCISAPMIQEVPVGGMSFNVKARWNMISLPANVVNGTITTLFTGIGPHAYWYDPAQGGYQQFDVLERGRGYWLKFSGAMTVDMTGEPVMLDSIDVVSGWNMIGSIGIAVPVTSVASIPSGIVLSRYYGYNNGYGAVTVLQPGQGYWVKCDRAGKLYLGAGLKAAQ